MKGKRSRILEKQQQEMKGDHTPQGKEAVGKTGGRGRGVCSLESSEQGGTGFIAKALDVGIWDADGNLPCPPTNVKPCTVRPERSISAKPVST